MVKIKPINLGNIGEEQYDTYEGLRISKIQNNDNVNLPKKQGNALDTAKYLTFKTASGLTSAYEGLTNIGAGALKGLGKATSKIVDNPIGKFVFGEEAADYNNNPFYQLGDSMLKNSAADAFNQGASTYNDKSYIKDGSLASNVASGVGQVVGIATAGKMFEGTKLLPDNTKSNILNKAAQIINNPTTKAMFASSAGNGYANALRDGASESDAVVYGLLEGTKETATEAMYGGLGKMFGKGALDDAVKQTVTNKIKSNIGKKVAELGIGMAAEGIEEVASTLLEPFVAYTYKHKLSFEDYNSIMDDFIVGALVSGVVQTGESAVNTSINKFTKADEKAKNQIYSSIIDKLSQDKKSGFSSHSQESIVGTTTQIITDIETRNNLKINENDGYKIKNLVSEAYIKNDGVVNPNEIVNSFIDSKQQEMKVSSPLSTEEKEELNTLEYMENSIGLNEEETNRLNYLKNKSNNAIEAEVVKDDFKTVEDKVLKRLNSQYQKAMKKSLEVGNNSLNLTNKEKQEFKKQLEQYKGKTKEELSNPQTISEIKNLIQNYAERNVKVVDDELKEIKNVIRKTRINVDDYVKNQFDKYSEFKKSNFGKLNLSNSGDSIDSTWQELCGRYPQYFDIDITSEVDMLNELSNFMNMKTEITDSFHLSDKELDNISSKIYDTLLDNTFSNKEINQLEKEMQNKVAETNRKKLRRETIAKYRDLARNYIKQSANWKDKSLIGQKANTMKRNLRNIMSNQEASAIYEEYFQPISKHNAAVEKEINRYNDKIRELNLNKKEQIATQMLGEVKYNPDTKLLTKDVLAYISENNIDRKKIDNAIEVFRNIYDELFARVNNEYRKYGMEEFDYRKGYFPHFSEEHGKGFIGKIAENLGWKFSKTDELPTDIAGMTEFFSPSRKWMSFAQHRTGDITEYNAYKGFDAYVRGAMHAIYYTEDIQKLRGLENEIRYQHSDEGLKKEIDAINSNEELDENSRNTLINEKFKNYDNELANFVTNLMDFTNNIAGKKSSLDRSIENLASRKVYNVLNNVNNRVSANMVAGNIGSALTNFIPITQAWSQISTSNMLKAMAQTISNQKTNDNFIDRSTFLTNRLNNADTLYKSKLQKVSDKLGFMFDIVDGFTSETIVRGKYLDNIKEGMSESEALKNADEFAKDVMAGRSLGDQPTLFNSKSPFTKLFTAFQLEVNNQYEYMFKDIPNDLKDKGIANLVKAFAKMFIGAFLYNQFAEKLTGRKSAFSPVDIVKETIETVENDNLSVYDKVSNTGKNLAQEIPYIGGLLGGGRLPISGALPDVVNTVEAVSTLIDPNKKEDTKKTAKNNLIKEVSKPLYYLLPPFGGGQAKKTIEGLSMYDKNLPIAGSYTSSGDLRFEADTTLPGITKAALFGQYASKNANDYIDSGYKTIKSKDIKEMKEFGMNAIDYKKYRTGLSNAGNTNSEKIDYIVNLEEITDTQKNKMAATVLNRDFNINEYRKYNSYEEYDYAYKNPENYLVLSQITSYDNYSKYKTELNDIRNKTAEDKKETFEYIRNLKELTLPQKAMFIKQYYKSYKNYDKEIIEYVKKQDLSMQDKITVLTKLGYTIRDGRVYI